MVDEPKKTGYGNPPDEHKIKPGEKRSPGRPKGSRNKKTYADRYIKIADEKIGGQSGPSQASIDLAIKRLRKLALTGEGGADLKVFLDKYEQLEKVAAAVAPSSYPFSDLDKQVMDEMYRRMKSCVGESDD